MGKLNKWPIIAPSIGSWPYVIPKVGNISPGGGTGCIGDGGTAIIQPIDSAT